MTPRHAEMKSCLHAKDEPAASALPLLCSFISCPPTHHAPAASVPSVPRVTSFLGGSWDQSYRQTLYLVHHSSQTGQQSTTEQGWSCDGGSLASLGGQRAHTTSLTSSLCRPQRPCNHGYAADHAGQSNSPKLIICP